MEEPIQFECQGQQVVGMIHIPDNFSGEPVPGLVFFHDFKDDKTGPARLFVIIARQMSEMGFTCLRVDFRGSGDSDGKFVDTTISTQIHDAHYAVDYLRERPEVDPNRVGILAMGMSSIVAAYLLSADHDIKATVLLSPVADTESHSERASGPTTINDLAARGYTDIEGWCVSKTFIKELNASKPVDEIIKSPAPVLLIHGDADEVVPVSDSAAYEEELEDEDRTVKKHIIREADHKFGSNRWQYEVMAVASEWFMTHV